MPKHRGILLGHLLGGDCQILAVAAGFGDPAGAAGRNDNAQTQGHSIVVAPNVMCSSRQRMSIPDVTPWPIGIIRRRVEHYSRIEGV